MAFNWFISVIWLQFDLIQTTDVCHPPRTLPTFTNSQQMAELVGEVVVVMGAGELRDRMGRQRWRKGREGEDKRRKKKRETGQKAGEKKEKEEVGQS